MYQDVVNAPSRFLSIANMPSARAVLRNLIWRSVWLIGRVMVGHIDLAEVGRKLILLTLACGVSKNQNVF